MNNRLALWLILQEHWHKILLSLSKIWKIHLNSISMCLSIAWVNMPLEKNYSVLCIIYNKAIHQDIYLFITSSHGSKKKKKKVAAIFTMNPRLSPAVPLLGHRMSSVFWVKWQHHSSWKTEDRLWVQGLMTAFLTTVPYTLSIEM